MFRYQTATVRPNTLYQERKKNEHTKIYVRPAVGHLGALCIVALWYRPKKYFLLNLRT